jgi:hypothetical protein
MGSKLEIFLEWSQLPPKYDIAASFIKQSTPNWDVACIMIQLEQQQRAASTTPDPISSGAP